VVTDRPLRSSAKRIRRSQAGLAAPWQMMVKCEQCGEEFGIAHGPAAAELAVAARQAKWLAEQFVWDHIQENKHKGCINLPPL